MDYVTVEPEEDLPEVKDAKELAGLISELKREMREAALELEFERAAELRDRLRELEKLEARWGGGVE